MSTLINTEKLCRDVIVIGASAGGISALDRVLAHLPADIPAFVGVVIHRGGSSNTNWADVLFKKASLRICEPLQGEPLQVGTLYIAPADCHMTFKDGSVNLDRSAKEHYTRPAVDPLFKSAALAYGPRVVAVVLSGGGQDGADGLLSVATGGGLALVQEPGDAEQGWMPRNATAVDHVSASLTAEDIGDTLNRLAHGDEVLIPDSAIPNKPLQGAS